MQVWTREEKNICNVFYMYEEVSFFFKSMYYVKYKVSWIQQANVPVSSLHSDVLYYVQEYVPFS